MPRSRSIAIQSERVERRSRLALTWPARLMAPPNSSSFSVSVVLPASGCEMMAKVRRRRTSEARSAMERWERGPAIIGRWHTRAMPELPDVTVYAERLAARVVGQRLNRIKVMNPFLVRTAVPPLATVERKRVEQVERLAKR